MRLHLIDGTFELFRAFYSKRPDITARDGMNIKGVYGVVASLLALLREEEVTHVAAAFDNPVESFRNDMFDGYKTGEGIDPELWAQFDPVEEAVAALGVTVWSLDAFEADDQMAAAAWRWADDVEQVRLLTPDKDLGQCIRGTQIVQVDRIRKKVVDEAAFRERRGFAPESMPDYLALVGDTADGIPGLKGFGEKSVSRLLSRWGHLEDIPKDPEAWDGIRGAKRLVETLTDAWEDAVLYRELATLRDDVPLPEKSVAELEWSGVPRDAFSEWCERWGTEDLQDRPHRWRE